MPQTKKVEAKNENEAPSGDGTTEATTDDKAAAAVSSGDQPTDTDETTSPADSPAEQPEPVAPLTIDGSRRGDGEHYTLTYAAVDPSATSDDAVVVTIGFSPDKGWEGPTGQLESVGMSWEEAEAVSEWLRKVLDA